MYRGRDPDLVVSSENEDKGLWVEIPVGSGATASGDHVPANAVVERRQSGADNVVAVFRGVCYG
jgi:hypothetical protein